MFFCFASNTQRFFTKPTLALRDEERFVPPTEPETTTTITTPTTMEETERESGQTETEIEQGTSFILSTSSNAII